MLKIPEIKKQEGAISLFVLLSLLFFLVVVTSVALHLMQTVEQELCLHKILCMEHLKN